MYSAGRGSEHAIVGGAQYLWDSWNCPSSRSVRRRSSPTWDQDSFGSGYRSTTRKRGAQQFFGFQLPSDSWI